VEARSAGLGKGSEFIVRLPVVAGDADATAGPLKSSPSAALQHRAILVVDDNRDSADSLAMLLRLMGADVRVAYGGKEAIAEAVGQCPVVMFVDIGMPDCDGYEVARRVRQIPECARSVLIALT